MLLVHPIRELIRFLPVLIGLRCSARTAAGGRAVAAARRRDPDRARPAALPDHELPDHRRPGRAAARAAQPARALDAARPGPHRRPDRLADPPAARADHGPDRHRHRLDKRRGPARPRRAAAATAARALRGRAAADLDRRRRGGRRARAGRATVADLRPGVGAVRAADRQPGWSSARPRSVPPASCCRPSASSSGSTRSTSTAPRLVARWCWSRCWCSALLVVVSLLAIGGYVVTNWGFRLTRTARTRRLAPARGLFTTRETTLDDDRVARRQPRRAARAPAGRRRPALGDRDRLDREPAGQLRCSVPPAPRPVVERVAGEVLDTTGPGRRAADRARPARRPPPLDPGAASRRSALAVAVASRR